MGSVEALPVLLDDGRHDVRAGVTDAVQIDETHPMKVAAGQVEQRANTKLAAQRRQLATERGCLLEARAVARARLGIPPVVAVIVAGEEAAPVEPGKVALTHK